MEDPAAAEARIRRTADLKKEAADNALNGTNLEWAKSTLGEAMFSILGVQGASLRIQDVKNQVDEDAQRQIADMQQKYKALEADMQRSKSYAGMYEDVVKQLEASEESRSKQSEAEIAAKLALSERNDQSISKYQAARELNSTQVFADDVLGSKLTGPLEKFNKLSEEIDKLRTAKNSSLMQAYGIAKEISENGAAMSSEEMKKKLAKQSKFEGDASAVD